MKYLRPAMVTVTAALGTLLVSLALMTPSAVAAAPPRKSRREILFESFFVSFIIMVLKKLKLSLP